MPSELLSPLKRQNSSLENGKSNFQGRWKLKEGEVTLSYFPPHHKALASPWGAPFINPKPTGNSPGALSWKDFAHKQKRGRGVWKSK